MCDTFVALPPVTRDKSVLFAKSADCEVNEANAIVRIPGRKHMKGEAVRVTHLVIPQAEETYEIFLTKAFWTYGCEIGINEYGLAMGEEAVFTTEMAEEKDGLIGPDLMRIGLERARTCQEAIEIMTWLLEQYGQGGSAELKGNSHFDSSFLMSDTGEAYILETAGRKWAVRKVEQFDSISNMLGISTNWSRCSVDPGTNKSHWAQTFGLPEVPPTLGSPDRQCITYDALKENAGQITASTMFNIMRHHNDGYHPATADAHRNICIHAGPQKDRWWQADGVMVTEVDEHGILIWVTGTSGNCVSIFKPVFMGLDLPDIGPRPGNSLTHAPCGGSMSCSTAGQWLILITWCLRSVETLMSSKMNSCLNRDQSRKARWRKNGTSWNTASGSPCRPPKPGSAGCVPVPT